MNLLDISEQLNKTMVKIAVDLSAVKQLRPDEEFTCMADGPAEVYIVNDGVVHAIAINADQLVLRAQNFDL